MLVEIGVVIIVAVVLGDWAIVFGHGCVDRRRNSRFMVFSRGPELAMVLRQMHLTRHGRGKSYS